MSGLHCLRQSLRVFFFISALTCSVNTYIPNSVNALINDLEIRVVFSGPNETSYGGNQVNISYETRVEIEYQEEKPYENFLSIIRHLQNFFSLAMGVPTYPISIVGLSDSNKTEMVNGKNYSIPIEIYYTSTSWPEKFIENHPSEMLFTLPTIESNFEAYMHNWIERFDLLEPCINLYFSVLYNPQNFAEVKFLLLTQAIETYHSRVFGGQYQSDEEYDDGLYKQLVNALPQELNTEFKTSLKSRLKYGNEYSLRTRLREIIKSVNKELSFTFVQSPEDTRNFIGKVVDTRNYWTHYTQELADRAAKKGDERLMLATSLQLLLEICFLKEVGFDSSTIQNIIQRSERFRLLKSRGY